MKKIEQLNYNRRVTYQCNTDNHAIFFYDYVSNLGYRVRQYNRADGGIDVVVFGEFDIDNLDALYQYAGGK